MFAFYAVFKCIPGSSAAELLPLNETCEYTVMLLHK